jgi:hypothetical protein
MDRSTLVKSRLVKWVRDSHDSIDKYAAPSIDEVFDHSLARQELYSGVKKKSVEGARKRFILKFAETLEAMKETDFKANHTSTIKLARLVGDLRSYKAAIAEEKDSQAFRAAVVMAGVQAYSGLGQKWTEPKHLIIGGSSGAGKTYGAKTIIKALMKHSITDEGLKKIFFRSGRTTIKHFVSVDGGDARAVSQIRKMVLQCALALGYRGIEDLHKHTKLDIKDQIKAAAFHGSSRVHVVEPRTFSDIYNEKYSDIRSRHHRDRVIFCMVQTDSGVIKKQGESRAWYDYSNEQRFMKPEDLDINNPNPGCESKKYSDAGLTWGYDRSRGALDSYVKSLSKAGHQPIVVTLENSSSIDEYGKIRYSNPKVRIERPVWEREMLISGRITKKEADIIDSNFNWSPPDDDPEDSLDSDSSWMVDTNIDEHHIP